MPASIGQQALFHKTLFKRAEPLLPSMQIGYLESANPGIVERLMWSSAQTGVGMAVTELNRLRASLHATASWALAAHICISLPFRNDGVAARSNSSLQSVQEYCHDTATPTDARGHEHSQFRREHSTKVTCCRSVHTQNTFTDRPSSSGRRRFAPIRCI
jgi:hypothetical protein